MLKTLLKNHIKTNIPENEKVAIMFSGGMDSLSVLLSALELGYDVKLYTFCREGLLSKDLESARFISDKYKLELEEVYISNDLNILISDLKYLVEKHDLNKKTQFQVMHSMKRVCDSIDEKYVLSGLGADTLYGNMRSIRKVLPCENEFRNIRSKLINDPKSDSFIFVKNELESLGKIFVAPYRQSTEIIDYFLNLTIKDLCYGKQKRQTYEAFKSEIERLNLYRRSSSMQINSGIRELHDKLLLTDLNNKNFKSVTGIYNNIIREVKEK